MSRFIASAVLLSFLSSGLFARDEKLSTPKLSENRSRFEQLELFNKVMHLVETQYYRPVSTEKLIEGALKGMMETLDPHSAFLSKDFFEKMQNDTAGEFGGLGLEVTQKDGIIYIVTPIDDTPAYRAGIKSKDKIVEINHEPIVGMTLDQVIEKIVGAKTLFEINTKTQMSIAGNISSDASAPLDLILTSYESILIE